LFVISVIFSNNVNAQRGRKRIIHGGIEKNKYRGKAKIEKKVNYGGRKVTVGKGRGYSSSGQNELGIFIGTTNSLTDIGGKKWKGRAFILDVQLKTTDPAYGIYFSHHVSDNLVAKYCLLYGTISGIDTLTDGKITSRTKRNFSFNNVLLELSGQLEYHIPKGSGSISFRSSPLDFIEDLDYYFFVGIAGLYHDPELYQNGVLKNNMEKFSKYQFVIPMGAGFSIPAGKYKIGLELGWRKTFTDYLDGFTRPWSKGYDSYIFTLLRIGYSFDSGRRGYARKIF